MINPFLKKSDILSNTIIVLQKQDKKMGLKKYFSHEIYILSLFILYDVKGCVNKIAGSHIVSPAQPIIKEQLFRLPLGYSQKVVSFLLSVIYNLF